MKKTWLCAALVFALLLVQAYGVVGDYEARASYSPDPYRMQAKYVQRTDDLIDAIITIDVDESVEYVFDISVKGKMVIKDGSKYVNHIQRRVSGSKSLSVNVSLFNERYAKKDTSDVSWTIHVSAVRGGYTPIIYEKTFQMEKLKDVAIEIPASYEEGHGKEKYDGHDRREPPDRTFRSPSSHC